MERPAQKKTPSAASKWLLSIGFIAASTIYAFLQNNQKQEVAAAILPAPNPIATTTADTESVSSTTPVTHPPPTPPTPPTPKPTQGSTTPPKGLYANGSYEGKAVDAFYGIVQVKAIIQNGKLANIELVQYPNDRDTTIRISNESLPILIQEAIAAQSAQVDGVSGATQTSDGFIESLESALTQARA
jgi:uncharacterized protein with FMN-binding domain